MMDEGCAKMIRKIEDHIRQKYGVEPEHPWGKYPENTTYKERENEKWFVLVMPVARHALGLPGEGVVYVMNVKAKPELISMIVGAEGYLPAYHMNKQHWLTVLLDGTVPAEQVLERIEDSYILVTESASERIYEAVRRIPKGKVATYGQVAAMAGNPKMSRAVGNALHKNPDPEGTPCYRVVNARGELSGEFAFGGPGEQAKRLAADGIEVIDGKVDLKKYGM